MRHKEETARAEIEMAPLHCEMASLLGDVAPFVREMAPFQNGPLRGIVSSLRADRFFPTWHSFVPLVL